MANALLYDCFSGISGDMHIGAMVDLGVPGDYLRGELARLSLASEFELELAQGRKMGITGVQATVRVREDAPKPHRRLAHIVDIIAQSGYAARVEARATAIFGALAEAEAGVHGIGIEEVHFHEVGATDAIVDIVAAALALEYLEVARAWSRPVEVGGGMVRCAHGRMPVPAPATAALLQGVPCSYGRVQAETTTPTGAAILACSVDAFEEPARFTSTRVGYGIGQKDFEIPNVLRVMLGDAEPVADALPYEVETNVEVECNVDDMSPEAFQPLIEGLFEAGARDVMVTPGLMKKSRPANRVSVLTHPDDLPAIVERLVRDSTTIGVRFHDVRKWMLPRDVQTVPTSVGKLQVKVAKLPNGRRRWKIEHDDVLRIARERGEDYLALKDTVEREIAAWMND